MGEVLFFMSLLKFIAFIKRLLCFLLEIMFYSIKVTIFRIIFRNSRVENNMIALRYEIKL